MEARSTNRRQGLSFPPFIYSSFSPSLFFLHSSASSSISCCYLRWATRRPRLVGPHVPSDTRLSPASSSCCLLPAYCCSVSSASRYHGIGRHFGTRFLFISLPSSFLPASLRILFLLWTISLIHIFCSYFIYLQL